MTVKKKQKSVRVTTPIGRLSFPYLFTPVDNYSKTEQEYRADLIFDDKADFTAFNKAVDEVLADKFGPNKKSWPMDNVVLPLTDQEVEIEKLNAKSKAVPDHLVAGNMMMKAKTKAKNGAPFVVDGQRNEIKVQSDVYGGCYGRLSVNLYVNSIAQKDPRTKKDLPPIHYVTCYLNGFQKTKDGDSFGGGRIKAEDAFDAIEDDGSDLL